MISPERLRYLPAVALLLLGLYSCRYYVDHNFRQAYRSANEILHSDSLRQQFLKVHYTNGDVALFDDWALDESGDSIVGQAQIFDYNRMPIYKGGLISPIDQIAIIETNDLDAVRSKDGGRIAALAILSGANLALGIFCMTNYKACFGSCPTFYLDAEHPRQAARAEGFSSATAPSLAYRDVDALDHVSRGGAVSLVMKNEALETQVVDELQLLAVPKKRHERIAHHREDAYFSYDKLVPPQTALANGKDIQALVSAADRREYFSPTDSTDLFTRESIELVFDEPPIGRPGLLIHFRQTLLSTYLFYTGLAWAGDEVGDHYARVETDPFVRKLYNRPFDRLGGIDVSYWQPTQKRWIELGHIRESGPIAVNRHLLPLPGDLPRETPLRLKLEMTKGHWRLDFLGLAALKEQLSPLQIPLRRIEVIDGHEQDPASLRADDDDYLVTFPGNAYRLHFTLPKLAEGQDYELFLASQGYYLEWMRDDWFGEKNTTKLTKLVYGDVAVWQEIATSFKAVETAMESQFWNSKFEIIQ